MEKTKEKPINWDNLVKDTIANALGKYEITNDNNRVYIRFASEHAPAYEAEELCDFLIESNDRKFERIECSIEGDEVIAVYKEITEEEEEETN